MNALLRTRLAPFRHSAFRKFFFMQTLSLVGTWAHDLARAWVVINLLGRASALGSLLLAIAIPGLFLTLQGGVLADRLNVKKIMMISKIILAIASLGLAFVVEFANLQIWHLWVFGVIEGAVTAFDGPTFQALTVRLVPREDFQQAIAINSTNFHGARMLGPIVAGLLLKLHGPSLVFLFDALSFLGLIIVLSTLKIQDLPSLAKRSLEKRPASELLREGLSYSFTERSVRRPLLQLLLTIMITAPVMMVVFRTFMAAKFHLSGPEFGALFMWPSVGSLLGALALTVGRPENPISFHKFSVPLAVFFMASVSVAPNLFWAGLLMGLTGFFMYVSIASLTITIHLAVKEEYRGRVSSLLGLGFNCLGPLMSYPLGAYADAIGFENAIVSLALAFGVGSFALAKMGPPKKLQANQI